MRRLRWALLAAVVLAFPASASAAAGGGQPIVAPSGSHDLAQKLKTFAELPAPVNPWASDSADPCVRIGPHGKTLIAVTFGNPVTCTAELGTVLYTGVGHFCSTFDPKDSDFYADNPKDGRECARSPKVSPETGVRVRVDHRPPVDLFQPQYTAHTPPTEVRLPVDNVFGIAPQRGTIYAYGWHANIRNLRVGRHLIVTEIDVPGEPGPLTFPHIINIVPRGSLAD
jgi:hypothetical protein